MVTTTKKIVISGYYGFHNSGDEAVLKSILTALESESQRTNVQIEPIVLSSDPEWTQQTYGVRAVHRMKLGEVRSAIKESDGLISGGGSLLQDATGWKSIPYYLGILKLAQNMKKPTFIYAQGIGPVQRGIFKPMIRGIFKHCEYISVRDEESAKLIQDFGVRWNDVRIVPDPVMGLPLPEPSKVQKAIYGGGSARRTTPKTEEVELPVIGVSVRFWEKDRTELDRIAEGLKQFATKRKVHIRFLPFHLPSDEEASSYVKQKIGHLNGTGSKVSICSKQTDPQMMLLEVSRCELVLGMRLHSLIYAASQRVPLIGISYDPKIDAFLHRLESEAIGSTDTLQADKLTEELEKVFTNRNEWLESREEAIASLKEQAQEPAVQILKFLSGKG
ncbi:polysaccharide pyruvyl transferase CsaB [Paenibacillus sp. Marseille-Q4541]|uniref:polysaccharide pyruvyl transferase CsaB n=1 Tax=Paenibacillus sp. Marseille-Q4541 TaxID=2831522 RepID=UPI001BA6B343|nr:polysaccharide pyruvyl transferase CsaB [Paenibacillus sp. Marseille-Q4541]